MKKIKTNCPTCGKADTWRADNPFKPFCQERCKLIDLGEWASETRRVAGEPVDPKSNQHSDESED